MRKGWQLSPCNKGRKFFQNVAHLVDGLADAWELGGLIHNQAVARHLLANRQENAVAGVRRDVKPDKMDDETTCTNHSHVIVTISALKHSRHRNKMVGGVKVPRKAKKLEGSGRLGHSFGTCVLLCLVALLHDVCTPFLFLRMALPILYYYTTKC